MHLAAGAHDILLQAEYILTRIPPSVSWPAKGKTKPNVKYNQPKNAQQGIKQVNITVSCALNDLPLMLLATIKICFF